MKWTYNVIMKKKNLDRNYFVNLQAFTLAEVLITLGIIGVVAAIDYSKLDKQDK